MERDDTEFEDIEDESAPQHALKRLRDKLKACQKEKQEYLDGWQRMKADYVNLRNESATRSERAATATKEAVFEDLLPIFDSFELAVSDAAQWKSLDENWRKGVEQIHSQLVSVAKKNGLEPFDPTGEPFDPNRHQSIGSVPAEGSLEPDTVAEVLQRGYLLDGAVLRPAMVKITQ